MIQIDDRGAIFVDGRKVYPVDYPYTPSAGERVFLGFDENRHCVEYEGVVADIQSWYYGSVIRQAWCATSLCYFADRAGVLDALGGKHDNVYEMLMACRKAAAAGKGTMYERGRLPEAIPQYAVCFWLWDGDLMDATSSKHVGLSEYASSGDIIYCIGGNQNDTICTKAYTRDKLYAIYIIN